MGQYVNTTLAFMFHRVLSWTEEHKANLLREKLLIYKVLTTVPLLVTVRDNKGY